jgi:hypothetical protein
MSLSQFLGQSDVRQKFRQEFVKPTFRSQTDLLVPPLPEKSKASLVGTAFDYLLRFHIERLNPQAVTRPWIGEDALHYLAIDNPALFSEASERVSQAKQNHSAFLKAGELTDKLLNSILYLAQLEPIFRRNYIFEGWKTVEELERQNLRKLLSVVDSEKFKTNGVVALNPTFGLASELVGGADADLLIDDLLIDIKTTKELSLEREAFNQLIGYYTLYTIDGIDGTPPQHEVKRLGIYFSRYAYLHIISVENVIDFSRFPQFLEWFRERANKK